MGKFLGALPSKDTQKRARMNCQLNSCPYSTYYVTFHIDRFAIGKEPLQKRRILFFGDFSTLFLKFNEIFFYTKIKQPKLPLSRTSSEQNSL